MLREDPWEMIDTMQSMFISSLNPDGTPHSSYAPFVRREQHFFIAISRIAKHARNLLTHPQVSILFIEDESKSANILARKRVSFDALAEAVARDTVAFETAMTHFETRFGEMAQIYRTMKDFQLFRIQPMRGRAVFGFGQAYDYVDGRFGNVAVGSGHRT